MANTEQSSLGTSSSRHEGKSSTGTLVMRVPRNEDGHRIPIGGLSGLGPGKQLHTSPTSSRSPQDSLLRRHVFWDGLLEASESGRKNKSKVKPKRPDPPGFPPASTLLRPVLEDRPHFLDSSVQKFKPHTPSWGQQWRFRIKPFGRLSSRTKVVEIKLEDELGIVSQNQLFKEPELSMFGVAQTLKTAAHDPRIDGVLMTFDSPLLSMAGIMEVRRAMAYFVQSGKFLWGFTESYVDITTLCLLGGCTRRMATPDAYCNVIGFSTEAQFFRKALENVGIEPAVKRIGEFKSFGDSYSRDSMSAAQREVSTNLLETISGFKTELLARSANKTEAEIQALYEYDVPLEVKAMKDFGLFDDVLYKDQMMSLLAGEVASDVRKTTLIQRAKVDAANGLRGKLKLGAGSSKLTIDAPLYLKRVRKNRVEGVPGRTGDKTIAIINASGGIVLDSPGGLNNGDNLVISDFRSMVTEVMNDKSIDGIVVRISSPGGDASASDLMWREVRRLREADKVVVASVADVAASGGYYIAMGCERIVCDDLSITGSIGVVSAYLKTGELLEKVGITSEMISKGKYAELFAQRSFTAEEDAYFGRGAMASYNEFVGKAALSRRMPVEDMRRRAQGRVWTGAEAKALGLVDDLGGLDKAIEVCRDMVDLRDLARVYVKFETKKQRGKEAKAKAKESKGSESTNPAEKSTAAAKFDGKGKGNNGVKIDASDILYDDDEVPFGPLGIPPEKYTELQAKAVKDAEIELQKRADARAKKGEERLTKVINVQPPNAGVWKQLGSIVDAEPLPLFGAGKRTLSPSDALLKGLGSLMSPQASRPLAVLDDNIARMIPGVSGVPKELSNLGIGPLLYSLLLRSPGFSDALLEMIGRIGLSSILRK